MLLVIMSLCDLFNVDQVGHFRNHALHLRIIFQYVGPVDFSQPQCLKRIFLALWPFDIAFHLCYFNLSHDPRGLIVYFCFRLWGMSEDFIHIDIPVLGYGLGAAQQHQGVDGGLDHIVWI